MSLHGLELRDYFLQAKGFQVRINNAARYGLGLLIGIAIGKLLFGIHLPPDGQSSAVVAQKADQKQGLKCTVSKKTKPNGESEEKFEAVVDSSNNASNEVKLAPKNNLNLSLGIGVDSNLKPLASAEIAYGKLALEVQHDFKLEYKTLLKYNILGK